MFNKAIAEYKQALKTNPNYAQAHNDLAVDYYYHRGEYSLAIRLGYQVHPEFLKALEPHGRK